jgi:hypothetical protein
MNPISFNKLVFDTLYSHEFSSEEVEEREIRGKKMHYLKWSVARKLLLQYFPDYQIKFIKDERPADGGVKRYDCMYFADGTAQVTCEITIGGWTQQQDLAVMDNRYNAIKNPSATDINNTKQRCFVKCASLFGLGLKIFEGTFQDDIPEGEVKNGV